VASENLTNSHKLETVIQIRGKLVLITNRKLHELSIGSEIGRAVLSAVAEFLVFCSDGSSVPSRRRISGSAEFWPAAENPPK